MSTTKNSVILIRHGESLGNVDHKYYRLPDVANILTQRGVDQCIKLRSELGQHLNPDMYGVFTTVYASRFHRTQLTAKIVLAGYDMPINIDQRINETRHSDAGLPMEPNWQVARRVLDLVKENPYNTILFTHGMLMGSLDLERGHALNCELRKYDREDFIARLERLSRNDDSLILKA